MSTSSTTTALAGLSGYDFSSIIDMMVTSYRQPETNLQSQQTTLKTQQSAWQTAKTRLSALENTLAALKDPDTWTTTKATSSNTDILSVTGGTAAVNGIYNVTVDQMAQAWTAVTKVMTVGSTTTQIGNEAETFHINGTDAAHQITIAANSSLTDIQNAINSKSGTTGVQASIVQVADGQYRIAFTSTKSGADNVPTFTDDSGNLGSLFGFTLNTSTANGTVGAILDPHTLKTNEANASQLTAAEGGITLAGADAQIELNGLKITSSSNTITTAIQGVTLNLNTANSSQTIKVTVSNDSSVAQKAVQSFIDQYNSLMSFIDDNTNYDATTKTAGTLYADPTLRGIESTLRTMMGGLWQVAGGSSKILSDLGISTSADNYGESAALTFDTDKFQKALANDPQMVANLFGAPSNGVDPSDAQYSKASGIANILDNYLQPMVKFQGTLDQTNDSYTQQINDLQTQINDFEERASAYEDRIKLQFANLETSLTALNQQSSSFTSLLNSLNSQTSSSK